MIGIVLLLVLLAVAALYLPKVQSKIVGSFVEKFSESMDGRLEFESIRIMPFNTLVLKNAVIIDDNPYTEDRYEKGYAVVDTLGEVRKLTATFTLRSLFTAHGVDLSRVVVEGGQFNLVTEVDRERNTNLERVFNLPYPQPLPEEAPDIFRFRRVKVRDFRFSMKNFRQTPYINTGVGINWEDMDLVANIDIHDMRFSNLIMSGTVDRLDCIEKCGYGLKSVNGRAVVGRGKATVTDLKIKDEWSDISMPLYEMRYKNSMVFIDFLNEVTLEGIFNRSLVAMQTIKNFSGVMPDNKLELDVKSGHMVGPVSDFTVTGMVLTDRTTGVEADLDCGLTGLPFIENTEFDVNARHLGFTTSSLSAFISNFIEGKGIDLGNIAKGVRMDAKVKASGTLDNLKTLADVSTALGSVHVDGLLANVINPAKDITIDAFVKTGSLDAGKLLGTDAVGEIDCALSANAELIPDNIRIRVDSLSVDRARLLDYEYRNIFAKGGFGKRGPYGTAVINDPNLKAMISGEDMHFYADIPLADLEALKFDTRGGTSKASLKADMAIDAADNVVIGSLDVSDFIMEDKEGKHNIGSIRMDGRKDEDGERYSLDASFVKAGARLSGSIKDLLKDIQYATTRRDLYALYTDAPENRAPADCNISVNLFDTRELISLFVPDLYVSDKSSMDLSIRNGELSGKLNSQRIALGANFLKDIILKVDNKNGRINLTMDAEELNVGGLPYNRIDMDAYADDNEFEIGTGYCYNNQSDKQGKLTFKGSIDRDEDGTLGVHARPENSFIYFGGKMWELADSQLHYIGKRIIADDVVLHCENESIIADGAVNLGAGRDTMRLRINDLDLGITRDLLKLPAQLEGRLDGNAVLISPLKDRIQLTAAMKTDDVKIDGISAGDFTMGSRWDDAGKQIIAMVQNKMGGSDVLDANISFSPSGKTLEGDAYFDNFRIDPFAPFAKNIFTRMEGKINGHLECSGSTNALAINSREMNLDNTMLQLAFTGVPYTINGPFSISNEALTFDNLQIEDDGRGRGSISGGLKDFMKKPVLDARLTMRGLKVLDMPAGGNDSFYGSLAASGWAGVSGTFDNLAITGDVMTAGPGEVHIPLNSSLTQSRGELLTFVQREEELDPYDEMRMSKTAAKKTKGNLSVKAHAGISPDVMAFAEIDKSSGNLVSVNGTGDLDVDIDLAKNNFQVDGDYNIAGGNYHFAIPGLIGKDLTISDGGSIKFGGDIMESQLDITALYSLKTSLAPLSSDTTSVSTRRPVNCSLNISDKISNPQISFAIDIPDLDPTTESSIRTALNTEDKVQKQFISLLVFNTFLPSESSGVINGSNMLYANMTEMFSGQVNSILQKLEIPLDLGFGYQANDGGTDIFDVAVSTQLFNNRVVVGGSVGNRKYSTSASANGDVVGDLDIEVKLDRSGQFRFKLFSHSADEFTSFLDYSQRNGVGVTYQKEYDTISDIFKPADRRRRENEKTVTIKIDE